MVGSIQCPKSEGDQPGGMMLLMVTGVQRFMISTRWIWERGRMKEKNSDLIVVLHAP